MVPRHHVQLLILSTVEWDYTTILWCEANSSKERATSGRFEGNNARQSIWGKEVSEAKC